MTDISAAAQQFPEFAGQEITVEPLEKGGSDRKFYRVRAAGQSRIYIQYGTSREENSHYVEIAEFLHSTGLNVPKVYHHDADAKVIWMQDLGEVDLWHYRNEPWTVRRPLYLQTLNQAAELHTTSTTAWAETAVALQPSFDQTLYQWEQDYFFENCLQGALGLEAAAAKPYVSHPVFSKIIQQLTILPQALVHRDFQSQNIMIQSGDAWLIDFQGLRLGLPQYDLASLLYDPYVVLTEAERRELLTAYQAHPKVAVRADFAEVFDLCALQRLMQALGAYGFLGLKKGKPHFLNHIPAAKKSLTEVAARVPGLEDFATMLSRIPTQ